MFISLLSRSISARPQLETCTATSALTTVMFAGLHRDPEHLVAFHAATVGGDISDHHWEGPATSQQDTCGD